MVEGRTNNARSTPPPPRLPSVEDPKPGSPGHHDPPSAARRRLPLASTSADMEAKEEWHPLPLSAADLSLPLTLPTGQTFLWRRISLSPLRFTGAVGPHLISLSHLPDGRLAFLLHNEGSSSVTAARAALCDYLNAASRSPTYGVTSLPPTCASLRSPPGSEAAARGCSGRTPSSASSSSSAPPTTTSSGSRRWTLAGYGERLGGFVFHRFPTIEQLARVGAGASGGRVWVQVATQYLLLELAGKNLTPKLSFVVSDAFVTRFGSYAGWAQNVLFIGQLPTQKLMVDEVTTGTTKPTKRKRGKNHSESI